MPRPLPISWILRVRACHPIFGPRWLNQVKRPWTSAAAERLVRKAPFPIAMLLSPI